MNVWLFSVGSALFEMWPWGMQNSNSILNLVLIGFHHRKGSVVSSLLHKQVWFHKVELVYPSLSCDGSDPTHLPHPWRHLPALAIADGAHNYTKGWSQTLLVNLFRLHIFQLTFNREEGCCCLWNCLLPPGRLGCKFSCFLMTDCIILQYFVKEYIPPCGYNWCHYPAADILVYSNVMN